MRIAFFTEMAFTGKVPRNHPNMRVEFAWMVALDADHHNILSIPKKAAGPVLPEYDIAILIVGKSQELRNRLMQMDLIASAQRIAKRVVWMQEGPAWWFQDLPVPMQMWELSMLTQVDGILCHNQQDEMYYRGLVGDHPSFIAVNPSIMITDLVNTFLRPPKQEKVMIGGNFCRWYGGFDSFVVASELDLPIWAPSMGRKAQDEDRIEGLNHLPYLEWAGWITKLAEFKYAVHLMPTAAAGTFALNCAYLGIPCIGYKDIDTQRNLHCFTSVDPGDLPSAKKILRELHEDPDFYAHASESCRNRFKWHATEDMYLDRMIPLLTELLNDQPNNTISNQ